MNSEMSDAEKYNIDKRDFAEHLPDCPRCGATMRKQKAEKEDGVVMWPAYLKCPECKLNQVL